GLLVTPPVKYLLTVWAAHQIVLQLFTIRHRPDKATLWLQHSVDLKQSSLECGRREMLNNLGGNYGVESARVRGNFLNESYAGVDPRGDQPAAGFLIWVDCHHGETSVSSFEFKKAIPCSDVEQEPAATLPTDDLQQRLHAAFGSPKTVAPFVLKVGPNCSLTHKNFSIGYPGARTITQVASQPQDG